MAITDVSRKYIDNFRYFRRFLQGRGVNLRMTIAAGDPVTPVSPYTDERIAVPGLHSDDRVIAVFNMTDLVDVTGYLDDGAKKATLDVFSTNKGITFTARQKGTLGNKINVVAAAAAGNSLPLSVVIGGRDAVLGTTGHPGETVIQVNLATNSSGVALTDGSNSAQLVMAAVDLAQSHPAQEVIVDMVLDGNGTTDWTAAGIAPLAGGADFDQGPLAAILQTALSPYTNADILYTARKKGANGNNITIAYTAGSPTDGHKPTITVSTNDIVVTYLVGTTTAKDVIDAINGNKDASALVLATPIRYGTGSEGSAGEGSDTTGVIDTLVATHLAGGLDPAIQLTQSALHKTLMVVWLTHDQKDEN